MARLAIPALRPPEGSAVIGNVVPKNANDAGNIAELNLDTAQIGKPTGLLAHSRGAPSQRCRRVSPTGTCDPQTTPIANVLYQADYTFING